MTSARVIGKLILADRREGKNRLALHKRER